MSAARLRRPLCRDRRGTVAIEFAVTASVLLATVFGVLELGMLFWSQNTMQTAAALTARCAALNSCADPKAFAVSTVNQFGVYGTLTADDVTVSAATSPCNTATSSYSKFIKVTITHPVVGASGIPSALRSVTLTATACYPAGV